MLKACRCLSKPLLDLCEGSQPRASATLLIHNNMQKVVRLFTQTKLFFLYQFPINKYSECHVIKLKIAIPTNDIKPDSQLKNLPKASMRKEMSFTHTVTKHLSLHRKMLQFIILAFISHIDRVCVPVSTIYNICNIYMLPRQQELLSLSTHECRAFKECQIKTFI